MLQNYFLEIFPHVPLFCLLYFFIGQNAFISSGCASHSNARGILSTLLKATKWRDNDLLTANIEKISDAGENAEHMPRIALVPAALGPSDFCEVQPSVIALLYGGRSIV